MKPRRSTEESRELKARAQAALKLLKGHASQRELEKLLRISPTYLSRLYTGARSPSGVIVSLLAIVAANPAQLLPWIGHYWASSPTPDPSEESSQPTPASTDAAR